jgi:thiamine-phosphate pyrophosphorylase
MLLYLITDRRELGPDPEALDRLVELVGDASHAGIDLVQIRERDLTARTLVELCRRAAAAVAGGCTRVLVNDRFDVALAAGLAGVHLTTRSLGPRVVRAVAPGLLVGASTHSRGDAVRAEAEGADVLVCGPVFDTPSKRGMGEPLGPECVRAAARAVRIPVLALGGISRANAREASTDMAGLAAIRLFADAWRTGGRTGLTSLAADLRAGF